LSKKQTETIIHLTKIKQRFSYFLAPTSKESVENPQKLTWSCPIFFNKLSSKESFLIRKEENDQKKLF